MIAADMSPAGPAPRVTVVVACFNHASYVEDCLESVFRAIGPVAQVIITDDASSDATQSVILSLLERNEWHARTLFHSSNKGICATFNEALAMVETPYVAYLSADDRMHPQRFVHQVPHLDDDEKVGAVYSDMYLMDSDGNVEAGSYLEWFDSSLPGRQGVDLFRSLLSANFVPTPSVLLRTSAVRAVGGYDQALSFEDLDLWLRLIRSGYQFSFANKKLVYYRLHEGQMSNRVRGYQGDVEREKKYLMDRLRIVGKHRDLDVAMATALRGKVRAWAVRAYRLGVHPRDISPHLRWAARLDTSPKVALLALAASVGIPGQLLARLDPEPHS